MKPVSLLLLFAASFERPCLVLARQEPRCERLYVANVGSDNITVIDSANDHVIIGSIRVGSRPHGLAAPARPDVLFATVESTNEVIWIDPSANSVIKRVTVGAQPENLACTPDGRFLYVPCRKSGDFWVLDGETGELVTKIHTGGEPHNTACSADGRLMFLAPRDSPAKVLICDTRDGQRVIGEIPIAGGVRPIAISRDGNRLYANTGGLDGFQIADVSGRKLLHTIEVEAPAELPRNKAHHGVAIRPDQSEVWTVGGVADAAVFDLRVEPPRQIAFVKSVWGAYWITFAHDGRFAYISEPWGKYDAPTNKTTGVGSVAVVDARTKEIVKRIVIGPGTEPKRTLSIALPVKR